MPEIVERETGEADFLRAAAKLTCGGARVARLGEGHLLAARGVFAPLVEASTKLVATTVAHAGICKVQRYALTLASTSYAVSGENQYCTTP